MECTFNHNNKHHKHTSNCRVHKNKYKLELERYLNACDKLVLRGKRNKQDMLWSVHLTLTINIISILVIVEYTKISIN